MSSLILIVLTSVLSAVVTLGCAAWWFRHRVEPQLRRELIEVQEEFERRVEAGVKSAGEELMPLMREQVAAGFRDAIKQTATAGLVSDTAKVVNRSADLLEDGLRGLFGVNPRK